MEILTIILAILKLALYVFLLTIGIWFTISGAKFFSSHNKKIKLNTDYSALKYASDLHLTSGQLFFLRSTFKTTNEVRLTPKNEKMLESLESLLIVSKCQRIAYEINEEKVTEIFYALTAGGRALVDAIRPVLDE